MKRLEQQYIFHNEPGTGVIHVTPKDFWDEEGFLSDEDGAFTEVETLVQHLGVAEEGESTMIASKDLNELADQTTADTLAILRAHPDLVEISHDDWPWSEDN